MTLIVKVELERGVMGRTQAKSVCVCGLSPKKTLKASQGRGLEHMSRETASRPD